MANIYDYLMDKVDVQKMLDHYNFDYELRKDTYWLCCPFHSETEPSFTINADRKIFHCWGCKKKGNIINFVKEVELLSNSNELTYYESAKKLSKICNVRLNLTYKEELEVEQKGADDITDIITTDIQSEVIPQQETFMESAIKKFYVKKNNYMIDKGYPKEILDYLEMGFFTGDAKNPMNNRCVFPVRNEYGKLVGWTGRSILKDSKVKWFHAPPNRFQKSLTLYNIDKALEHILLKQEVNVVESVGNLIRMLQSDRYNTVATLGSTISKEQCMMLLSYDVKIIFWYDWDSGGFDGLNLAMSYIQDYDKLFVAITDYGINEQTQKMNDIGDVDVDTVNKTKIVSIYEYINIMKGRFVKTMNDTFEKDTKLKLSDGTEVLCTNKLNTKLEIPQLLPEDVSFLKQLDLYFGVKELSFYED